MIGLREGGCMYKDFMTAKPPSISGNPTPVQVMEWISKIETVFDNYDYNGRKTTILAAP